MSIESENTQANSSSGADPWDTALIVGPALGGVIALRGHTKSAVDTGWPNNPDLVYSTEEAIKAHSGSNYGIPCNTNLALDIDVFGEKALRKEVKQIQKRLPEFKLKFLVVTGQRDDKGRGRYQAWIENHGYEIHTQKITDHTTLRGYNNYVVGPGSIHPDTGERYRICDKSGYNDPHVLATLSDETLQQLAQRRAKPSSASIIFKDLGDGDVLSLDHPACIRRLLRKGAPTDQDYVQANHTLARYTIAAGLTDGDGAKLAEEMALHTPAKHPTKKGTKDKVLNFWSSLASARNNPEGNQFSCGYILGSKELRESGPLCNDCHHKPEPKPQPPSSFINPFYDIHQKEVEYWQDGKKVTIPLPTVNEEPIVKRLTTDELFAVIDKWVALDDRYTLEGPLSAFIANFLLIDNLLTATIDHPSSSKTLIANMLGKEDNQFVVTIGQLTEHSFVSGKPYTLDFIPKIRGRFTIGKDITTLLNGPPYTQNAILGQLNWLFDGHVPSSFGSGVDKNYVFGFVTWLCGTFALEQVIERNAALGPRVIMFKPVNDPKKAAKKAAQNLDYTFQMERELHEALMGWAAWILDRINSGEPRPEKSDEQEDEILGYCAVAANLRAAIHRDHRGDIAQVPDIEGPARLSRGIINLTQCRAFMYRHPKVDATDIAYACRLASDNVFKRRAIILSLLSKKWTSKTAISNNSTLPAEMTRRILEELVLLGVCEVISPTGNPEKYEQENLKKGVNYYRFRPIFARNITKMMTFLKLQLATEGLKHLEKATALLVTKTACQQIPPHTGEEEEEEENPQITPEGGMGVQLLTSDDTPFTSIQPSVVENEKAQAFVDSPKRVKKAQKQAKSGKKRSKKEQPNLEVPAVLPPVIPGPDSHTFTIGTEAFRLGVTVGCDIETYKGAFQLISVTDGRYSISLTDPRPLQWLLADPAITKVFHDATFDVPLLNELGVPVEGYQDTMLMARVLDNNVGDHGLKTLAQQHLGITLDKELQSDKKRGPVVTDELVEYNLKDSTTTLALREKLATLLTSAGLQHVYDKEAACLPAVVKLKTDGIWFDAKKAKAKASELRTRLDELNTRIIAALNVPGINLNGRDQVLKALAALGVELPDATKATYAEHVNDHPVIKLIIERNKLSTRITDLETKYTNHIGKDGRLHPTFKAIGTITGRMACKEPNLQNVDKELISYFAPAPGNVYVYADYSQAQLRILADLSRDTVLLDAYKNGLDLHFLTAQALFDGTGEVTDQQRGLGKTTNFALSFGQSAWGLQKAAKEDLDLDMTEPEAVDFRIKFFDMYSGLASWQETQECAPVITSYWGRQWHDLPRRADKYKDGHSWRDRLAYPAQANESEGAKESLILLYPKLLSRPTWLLVDAVHDSILLEVPEADADEAKEVLRGCMVAGMEKLVTRVPIEVDVKIGSNWEIAEKG